MNIPGIYKIESKIKPERVYIGSSMNIAKRWAYHLRNLRKDKHHSKKLQRHFNKYGESDLQFSILLGCDKVDLLKTEQYFIDSYKPYFNAAKIAGSPGNFKQSDEAKRKISEAFKGEKNPNYGKKFSKEHRQKLSESMKGRKGNNAGKKMSEEVKRKISESRKGKSNPHKGYPASQETREKLSASLKGRVPWNKGKPNPHSGNKMSDETKEKLRKINTGRVHSEKTKKQMSEWRTNYYKNKNELSNINLN
jgi:group I intron endonuclease